MRWVLRLEVLRRLAVLPAPRRVLRIFDMARMRFRLCLEAEELIECCEESEAAGLAGSAEV